MKIILSTIGIALFLFNGYLDQRGGPVVSSTDSAPVSRRSVTGQFKASTQKAPSSPKIARVLPWETAQKAPSSPKIARVLPRETAHKAPEKGMSNSEQFVLFSLIALAITAEAYLENQQPAQQPYYNSYEPRSSLAPSPNYSNQQNTLPSWANGLVPARSAPTAPSPSFFSESRQVTSRSNIFGDQDYSDGVTSRSNIFGGQDYSDGVTSRSNIFGGQDYSDGVTSRSNIFGGQDYSNGVTTRSNIFGGQDYAIPRKQ